MGSRAQDWLDQARNDLEWGRASAGSGFHSQACFIAQQVAEKALKALAYFRGAELVRGHSVAMVCHELEINGELEEAALRLDQYYIPTRYPDAQPAGAPFRFFSASQSSEALALAARFVEQAGAEIGSGKK
jgi:HEPN domain-containing protein